MKVAVIDGQGGGLGKVIVEKLKKKKTEKQKINIIALGTNAMATAAMIKAGADEGATGENAIIFTSKNVDIITGTVAIISANSILGEVTPKMAEAISSSSAKKILLPVNKCNIEIAGTKNYSLPSTIESLVERIIEIYDEE